MSYCKLNKAFVPEFYCLACEHCLPPSKRENGKMCPYDSYDETKEMVLTEESKNRIVEQVNSCETAMCAKISGEHLVEILDEMKERHGTMDR